MWNLARSEEALQAATANELTGNEEGLVARFRFGEGSGEAACDSLDATRCFTLYPTEGPIWSPDVPD